MLAVGIILCPGGNKEQARVIGSMRIWNMTPGLPENSVYEFSLDGTKGGPIAHRRSEGAWQLVRACLEEGLAP